MKQVFKTLLVIILASLGYVNLFAQKQGQSSIDSLLQELPKQKEDTKKVKILYNVSFTYYSINPDEGIKYGQKALDLSEKLEWKKGIAWTNNALGANYINKSDYEKALECWLKALQINKELGNKTGIARNLGNIGNVYIYQSNFTKSLEYYYKALEMEKELNDKSGIALNLGHIGIVYMDQINYPKALEYFFKALKIEEELGDKSGVAGISGNIGIIYENQKNYPKALEYDFKAYKINEEIGDNIGIARDLENIGNIYSFQANYTESIEFHIKALKMAEELGDKYLIADNLENIGHTYLLIYKDTSLKSTKVADLTEPIIRKYQPNGAIPTNKISLLHKAIDYLQQALSISQEINNPDILKSCYESLAEAYKLSGNYKKALECSDNYHAIKDSIFSKENNEKIVQLSMKNEYDQQRLADSLKTSEKEKITALQLHRQRSYTYMGIAGILLLVGFSFFIVKERGRSERERKKSDALLLNILPGEVANELKLNGTTAAKYYDNVTVLFTDFVNFTSAGERMSPQALIDELHTCFKAFDGITGKYKIEKIKTIGDAYLAVGGLPAADPKHAENVVRAAIDINTFMNDRLTKLGNQTFEMRIGIHSGSVVAGIVGVKKFAYDIWGDTVNTAARMEQNSEPGRINISQTTYELVKDKFTFEYRGEIDAKNKGQLKMYYVS